MRSAVLALLLFPVASLGCKKKPAPAITPVDAGAPAMTAAPPPSATPTVERDPDASAPPPHEPMKAPAPPLPVAPEKLEIVAIGKSWNSRVLWLSRIGSRVWLSAAGLDAFATENEPLVKGRDPLEKLPYKPGVHSMQVVGEWPHLFALRTKNVEGRTESPEAAVFVYAAEDNGPGTWTESKKTGIDWFPHAFLAFREGAILVTGTAERNAAPTYIPDVPNTKVVHVARDGSVSEPKLDIPRHFIAWDGSTDGDVLTLVGAFGVPRKTQELEFALGISLLRVGKDGTKSVPIQSGQSFGMTAYSNPVVEHAGRALIAPRMGMIMEELELWKPNVRTAFVVGPDNKAAPRVMPGGDGCYIQNAMLLGDAVYFHRHCYDDSVDALVRVEADGKSARIDLPRIVKKEGGGFRPAATDKEKSTGFACIPVSFAAREPDDLWINAKCGVTNAYERPAIPVVYRRGRPQEPVVIP